MTKKLSIGWVVICGALLLTVPDPGLARDCNANLDGYSWECTLQNVDNQQRMDFHLTFLNKSVAEINVPSTGFQASGAFACEMRPIFFGRRLVSGRSFLASLFPFLGGTTVTLTGDSYRHWILNGNGLNASSVMTFPYTTDLQPKAGTFVPVNASAFVYSCNNPLPVE